MCLVFSLAGCSDGPGEGASQNEEEEEVASESTPVFQPLGHREKTLWDQLYEDAGDNPNRLAIMILDSAEKLVLQVAMLESEMGLDEPELVAKFHGLKDELTTQVTPHSLDENANDESSFDTEAIGEAWYQFETAYDEIVLAVSEI